MKEKRLYLLYDVRARWRGTDDATVYTVSTSLEEARKDRDGLFLMG